MNPYFELLGTLSSIVVAVSLTMKNIRWLRTVNLIGAFFFTLYGFFIQSWPVLGLNAFIVVINTYYLIRLAQTKDTFSLLEVGDPANDSFLRQFLEYYDQDILKFAPDWKATRLDGARVVFVLRDVVPVSLFVCHETKAGTQSVLLDYAVPAWRDFHNARFFFNKGMQKLDWGKTGRFETETGVKSHQDYLLKIGFRTVTVGAKTLFVRDWGDSERQPTGQ
jgi:hypothetical protein